jgi:hypothetical protein
MLREPLPNLDPARVVFCGQVDVHACSLALPGLAVPAQLNAYGLEHR